MSPEEEVRGVGEVLSPEPTAEEAPKGVGDDVEEEAGEEVEVDSNVADPSWWCVLTSKTVPVEKAGGESVVQT